MLDSWFDRPKILLKNQVQAWGLHSFINFNNAKIPIIAAAKNPEIPVFYTDYQYITIFRIRKTKLFVRYQKVSLVNFQDVLQGYLLK